MKIITSPHAPAAIGPYSHAIQTGNLLFISGQLGMDMSGALVAGGVEAETKQALANIKVIVESAGTTLDKVVKTTILLADIADFPTVNALYGAFFGTHKPARATFQVAALPKGGLVEIEAIAVV